MSDLDLWVALTLSVAVPPVGLVLAIVHLRRELRTDRHRRSIVLLGTLIVPVGAVMLFFAVNLAVLLLTGEPVGP